MTCKDCKKEKKCIDKRKSYDYDKDGEAWAEWCDDFDTIHPDKEVEYRGVIAHQTGYNWHVHYIDADTHEWIGHASCTREMSEEELKKSIESFEKITNVFDDVCKDEEK